MDSRDSATPFAPPFSPEPARTLPATGAAFDLDLSTGPETIAAPRVRSDSCVGVATVRAWASRSSVESSVLTTDELG